MINGGKNNLHMWLIRSSSLNDLSVWFHCRVSTLTELRVTSPKILRALIWLSSRIRCLNSRRCDLFPATLNSVSVHKIFISKGFPGTKGKEGSSRSSLPHWFLIMLFRTITCLPPSLKREFRWNAMSLPLITLTVKLIGRENIRIRT